MSASYLSMSSKDAAKAFYGQDDASFHQSIAKLASADPRLLDVFKRTRHNFLDNQKSDSPRPN